jgi:hypothetical protein
MGAADMSVAGERRSEACKAQSHAPRHRRSLRQGLRRQYLHLQRSLTAAKESSLRRILARDDEILRLHRTSQSAVANVDAPDGRDRDM